MAETITNGQTCLEKRGISAREEHIERSDYNIENAYSATHKDAMSDGDAQGKGTGHGGHTFYLPDCNKPIGQMDYSNFDTFNGGGKYDIEGYGDRPGRNVQMARSLYNSENEYGPTSVDTTKNINEGQYFFEPPIGKKNS